MESKYEKNEAELLATMNNQHYDLGLISKEQYDERDIVLIFYYSKLLRLCKLVGSHQYSKEDYLNDVTLIDQEFHRTEDLIQSTNH